MTLIEWVEQLELLKGDLEAYTDLLIGLSAKLAIHEAEIQTICNIIYYQEHLKHQDNWLSDMIVRGIFIPEAEEEE